MTARADVIVVQHVAEAAVHERRPRSRRFVPITPQRAFGFAAHVAHVAGDKLRFRRQPARADRDTQRIEHALLEELDERRGQCLVAQRSRMARERARRAFAVWLGRGTGGTGVIHRLQADLKGSAARGFLCIH
jgi:hypothetical protein